MARACAIHPWRTLAVWLVVIVGVAAAANTFGGKLANDINIPGSDAQKAVDLLEERFPERSGDSTQIVFYSEDGLRGAEAKQAIHDAGQDVPGPPHQGNLARRLQHDHRWAPTAARIEARMASTDPSPDTVTSWFRWR